MMRRLLSVALGLACLFAAPVAFADGEEGGELSLAAEGYSAVLAVPAHLTSEVNDQLSGGTLDIDLLRCLEHPQPDGTVADSGCEPFSMEMVLADYRGIAATFAGQPYTIDFQASRVSTGGGAALAPVLPLTGLVSESSATPSANGTAQARSGESSHVGDPVSVVARIGAVVVAVAVGAGLGIRSKRRARQ